LVISGVFTIPLPRETAIAQPSDVPGAGAPVRFAKSDSPHVAAHFIAGPENALVRIVAEAVLGDGSRYNPIVLCGATGMGKTSLVYALTAQRSESRPNAAAIVTTGADFARAYAHAVEIDGIEDFRDQYANCELIVIDDLHRVTTKPAAQQELLSLLDRSLARGLLVVATLRHPPLETRGLLPGLASRLSGGLVVPLVPPHAAARRLIVEQIVAAQQIPLSPELIGQLTNPPAGERTPFTSAVQLRHAVLQLAGRAHAQNRTLDASLVAELTAEHVPEAKPLGKQILAAVAKQFQLPQAELKGACRKQAIVQARGLAMHLCRQLTAASYAEIGRWFGKRDHTTVMNACRRTESLLESDPHLRHMASELTTQFTSVVGFAPVTSGTVTSGTVTNRAAANGGRES
jgi:chromosomal replication initiator protein